MQKEGNTTWGETGAHTWAVWLTSYGVWRWEVSGPLGWVEIGRASCRERVYSNV